MALPAEIRQAVVIEPEPAPAPTPDPTPAITTSPNPLIGTTQGRGRIGTPLRRFGTNPFGTFGRPNPFLTALTNFLLPIAGAGPGGAVINPPRIAPRPAIITPGSTVTVRWRPTGNTAGVARYQVELFAVLPHRGAPQVSTVPLVRGFRTPTGAARETLALTIPNPLPATAIAGVTPVELTQLYVWPVVTAIGRLGVPISAIGRPGSMLPLHPAGTRAPAPVLTANRFNFDRGSFFQPGLSAPPPSFQFVNLAGGPLFAWTGMTRTNPGAGVITAWSPFGPQAASNAVVFDSFEGRPVASGYSSYNTAVRPGANLILRRGGSTERLPGRGSRRFHRRECAGGDGRDPGPGGIEFRGANFEKCERGDHGCGDSASAPRGDRVRSFLHVPDGGSDRCDEHTGGAVDADRYPAALQFAGYEGCRRLPGGARLCGEPDGPRGSAA
jgi:hypothetical protein